MKFIPTTGTATQKLKREAKALRKASGGTLAAALDATAKAHGYEHWKHVTLCHDQSRANQDPKQPRTLPGSLALMLDQFAKREPALKETENAFASGFVFAMDIKEAEDIRLKPEYVNCDDGWYIAAKDLWIESLYEEMEEAPGYTLLDQFAGDQSGELERTMMEDMGNYSFFRYTGHNLPLSVKDAMRKVSAMAFFAPMNLWLRGRFSDCTSDDLVHAAPAPARST